MDGTGYSCACHFEKLPCSAAHLHYFAQLDPRVNIAGALTDVLLEKGLQVKHNLVMRPHLSADGLLKQHLVGYSEDEFLRSHSKVWHS